MNASDLFRVIDGNIDLDAADREVIVLVHGGWTDHASWQFVRPQFAEDHVVVAYDRRGDSRRGPSTGAAHVESRRTTSAPSPSSRA